MPSPVFATAAQAGPYADALREEFIHEMAVAGQYSANLFGYPLPALIACACAESAYGSSNIYRATGNPFNLQKPSRAFSTKHHMPVYDWPVCVTLDQTTVSSDGTAAAPAPFCVATDLGDASRQFCEWISGFPVKARRVELEALGGDAVAFANALYKVGFADNKPARTKEYGKLVVSLRLRERYGAGPIDALVP